jgi:hypothetical protein
MACGVEPNKISHYWQKTPEGRQKCFKCGKLNPIGIPDHIRFWDHVDKNGPNGCWLWNGGTCKSGYGLAHLKGPDGKQGSYQAHRLAWYYKHSKWPEKTIDHLCRSKLCVNTDHMEDVSLKVNLNRRPDWTRKKRVGT